MASLATTKTIWSHSHTYHYHHHHPNSSSFTLFPSSPIHLRRSSCGPLSNHTRSFTRCHAGTPGPPPSPPPPPPPTEDETLSKGITSTISRFWDTTQIFIAVFIWMSLFFWASASDRNNTGSRNKGGRFRK
ncbi:hypothetical protein vseg_007167 [Gypsophila vaccaria]